MKKADNFNASKWLVENKITTQSKLSENLDALQPQNSQEKLLSSPIVGKDSAGNDIKLIGQESKGIFWDNKGKRYSTSGGNLYTPYELDRYKSIEFRKERAKTNHYFDTLKEEKPTNDMVKDYWSIMVENQPEDVIKILVGLTNGDLPFEKFSLDTANDVYDSFKDESYDDEDEELDENQKNISESIIDKIKSLFQRTPVETKLLNSLDLFDDNLLSPGEEKFNAVIEKAKKFDMNINKEQASNIIQKKLAMEIEDLEK